MITKEDFVTLAFSEIGKYPTLEMLYKAKDPRLFQNIEAIATMLAMFSQQLEVAQAEPFDKTRDSTVLADSAMRGIIPKSKPTILHLKVENGSSSTVEIGTGRNLLDSSGRLLRVETGATVEPNGVSTIAVSQYYAVEVEHVITESKPFYAIPIDMSHDESKLCGLKVECSSGCSYVYTDRYSTGKAGDQIYHIEVDDRQNFYIRFGYEGIVGVQPAKDTAFNITLFYSFGKITSYAIGDQVTFETYYNFYDSDIKLTIESVESLGEDPISIEVLRELAKYPSIYNKNAVYLGEFDFLVRSNLTNFQFLSVWNESLEENARSANVANINKLFFAIHGEDGQEKTLDFADLVNEEGEYLQPEIVTEYTVLQQRVKELILNADNGYSVQCYTPVKRPISIHIQAKVSTAYDAKIITKQMKEIVLETYGEGSLAMSKGRAQVLNTKLSKLLKDNIPALNVGNADLVILIEDVSPYLLFPEIWHFVSEESLDIEVTNINVTTGSWGVSF